MSATKGHPWEDDNYPDPEVETVIGQGDEEDK